MTTAKNTPTPWKIGSRFEKYIAIAGPDGYLVAMVETVRKEHEANAELIVRAVNSHAELVAALKDINTLANTEGEQPGFSLKAQRIARAALRMVGEA